jgi:hypothetical protein
LNSCDSGYADARALPGPFVLISTGLGQVPAGTTPAKLARTQEPVKWFAGLFADAVVDPAMDDDCDGLVTDRELQKKINESLKLQPASRGSNAIVFVKRQADADVPLFFSKTPAPRCTGVRTMEALLGAQETVALPPGLARDLRAQGELASGRSGKLVESALRYLAVEDTRGCADAPDDTLRAVERGLGPLGFQAVRLPNAGSETTRSFARDLARLARFTHVDHLTLEPSAVRLYDRAGRKILPLGAAAAACTPSGDDAARARAQEVTLRVLRCLPRRLELVNALAGVEDLGCGEHPPDPVLTDRCPIVGGVQECIGVRVDGRMPDTEVFLVRWQDLLAFGARAPREKVDWSSAEPIPCHSGTGQCFRVTNPRRAPRPTADWLLLEARFASAVEAKE